MAAMSAPERKPLPVMKRAALPAAEDYTSLKTELLQYWAKLPAEDVAPLRGLAIHQTAWITAATVVYGVASLRITRNTFPAWRYGCTVVGSLVGAVSGAMVGLMTIGERRWEQFSQTGAGRIVAPYWNRYGGRRFKGVHKE